MPILALLLCLWSGQGFAASDKPAQQKWSSEGLTGTFDRGALQRGFQVFRQVCATCHGMRFLRFEKLKALGYNKAQVKNIASSYDIEDGPNDEGEMFHRQGRPSDYFPSPYANENAARAVNNGAYPVDLSLIINARKYKADYLYALLTGYRDPPEGVRLNPGMHYNTAFPNHQISMPPPFSDGQIDYDDGTPATVSQMSRDVTEFLTWVSNPTTEERKRMGVMVLFYLAVFTLFMYLIMKRIWATVK